MSNTLDDIRAQQRQIENDLRAAEGKDTIRNENDEIKVLNEHVDKLLEEIRKQNQLMNLIQTRKSAYAYLGKVAGELNIPFKLRERAITMALNDMFDYGKIQGLMDAPLASDIQIYGDHGTFVYDNNGRREVTEARMTNDELYSFIVRKLAGTNYRFDLSSPRTDAILPDGSRLHIRGGASGWTVVDEEGHRVTRDCIIATIRKPLYNFSLEELSNMKMFNSEMLAYLEWVQRIGDGFVNGGDVGSGKSTVMAALIGKVPKTDMSCVMEEMPELQPLGDWVARLYTRPANSEGKGAITMAENLVDTLRMFYDNVYVGEVRTEEIAYEFLQTGLTVTRQTGTTTHATAGAESVIQRIALLAMGCQKRPTSQTVGNTFCTSIRHIIVCHKTGKGKRMTNIAAVLPYDAQKNAIPYVEVAAWDAITDTFQFFGAHESMVERARTKGFDLTSSAMKIQKDPEVKYVYL